MLLHHLTLAVLLSLLLFVLYPWGLLLVLYTHYHRAFAYAALAAWNAPPLIP